MVNQNTSHPKPKKPGLWRAIQSVLASMIGVQSEKNRKKDFEEYSNPTILIVVSVVFVIGFIAILIAVARQAIH